MSSTGKLIVIEGLEGAGKSTVVQSVMDLLAQKDIKAITTREPGGTALGEILRNLIKNPEYSEVLEDKSELLLLYAARIQLLKQVIQPALQEGIWVVADRFEWSTLAYQGGGRLLSLAMIEHLSAFCLNGFKPDLTLYLDITPELGMQRVGSRGSFDRIEQQSMDFFHRVREAYLECVQKNLETVVIDASLSRSEVEGTVLEKIDQFIKASFG